MPPWPKAAPTSFVPATSFFVYYPQPLGGELVEGPLLFEGNWVWCWFGVLGPQSLFVLRAIWVKLGGSVKLEEGCKVGVSEVHVPGVADPGGPVGGFL